MLLAAASIAMTTSAFWSGWNPWLVLVVAIIPILVHFLSQRLKPNLNGRVLVVYPDQPWELAFFSEETGLTDSIEVIVNKRWHHFFGLSLGLKLQKRPHNMPKSIMTVVWRQCLSAGVFREVAMEAARQVDGVGQHSKGDAA